jgi:hypothetical protein
MANAGIDQNTLSNASNFFCIRCHEHRNLINPSTTHLRMYPHNSVYTGNVPIGLNEVCRQGCGHKFWQTSRNRHLFAYSKKYPGVSTAVAPQRAVGTALPMVVLDTVLDLKATISGCTLSAVGRNNL